MNEGTILLNWVEETIHPQKLTTILSAESDLQTLRQEFATEIKVHRKILFKQLIISKRQVAVGIRQLIVVSDTLHHYLCRLSYAWKSCKFAREIRTFYLYALNSLETLLDDLGKLSPKFSKQFPLTHHVLSNIMMDLNNQFKTLFVHLNGFVIDHELKALVTNGISQFIHKKGISQQNVEYCSYIMKILSGVKYCNTEQFIQILLKAGFNLPEFYLYLISDYNNSIENIPGLHEQLERVIIEQDRINTTPQNRKVRMLIGIAPIADQLTGFLSEKKYHIKQMLKLRRVILRDDQLTKSMLRLKVNLSVAQLGLFIRVQMEKGLFLKENIGEAFSFFATHFYTPQTMFISAESLRKKSTEVEFNTAQKLKAHLIGMLNWLNENYNLSNYKSS